MSTDVPDPRARQHGVTADGLQRLWAPWRSGYVGGEDPIADCPFCALPARERAQDRDSLILHRGPGAFVVLNAYPYNPGHLMVVPYAHASGLDDFDGSVLAEVWELTTRAVAVLQERLDAGGVNVGMNLGAAAGAGIADHLHQHVVPRWAGDTNFMSTTASVRVLPQALAATYDRLAGGFA